LQVKLQPSRGKRDKSYSQTNKKSQVATVIFSFANRNATNKNAPNC
jgi:hypothetical protein